MKPEILLSSGRYYNFVEPASEVMTIEVIAGALSKMCRFSGHVSRFYSVAEHCWRASYLVPQDDALEALLHDAAEAFVVDLPTPLKRLLPDYQQHDRNAERLIVERFSLRHPWPESVHKADLVMLATERRDLMPATDTEWEILRDVEALAVRIPQTMTDPWVWQRRFLDRYDELAR